MKFFLLLAPPMPLHIDASRSVYFIGIGGIGLSGLARLYSAAGARVSGSDREASVVTDELEATGVHVAIGVQDASALPNDVQLVVRTVAAAPGSNAEVDEALKRGVQVQTYPEALGELTRSARTIAICGTHGKTTTSAMIAQILLDAGLDPSVLVGSRLPFLDGANARLGKGDVFVIEADEYRRAFDHYWPEVTVMTNVEFDHPDAFVDEAAVRDAFRDFLGHLTPDGLAILNVDDPGTEAVSDGLSEETASVLVSFAGDARAALVPEELILGAQETSFRIGKTRFALHVPGKHNVANALQAVAVADHLEIPRTQTAASLAKFTGTWRRFELRGERNGAPVIDDYAHHPAEIRATLQAARQRYPDRTIICVFQPHHRARLSGLLQDFSEAFSDADEVVLLPTYHVTGREEGEPDEIQTLVEKLEARKPGKVRFVSTFEEAAETVIPEMNVRAAVFVFGAGDITKLPNLLLAS